MTRQIVRQCPQSRLIWKGEGTPFIVRLLEGVRLNELYAFSLVAVLIMLNLSTSDALCQTPFYQGKTITIIRGGDAGGSGDARLKSAVPFLQKYIPGNPTILIEYMPGGGGRTAANHLYNTVRPDGLKIGNQGEAS